MLTDFIEGNSPSNIIVAGDLNISLSPSKKKGGVCGKDYFQATVEELIHVCNLNDFKPKKWLIHMVL